MNKDDEDESNTTDQEAETIRVEDYPLNA